MKSKEDFPKLRWWMMSILFPNMCALLTLSLKCPDHQRTQLVAIYPGGSGWRSKEPQRWGLKNWRSLYYHRLTVIIDINDVINVIFIVRCSREPLDILPGITTTIMCPGQTLPGSCQLIIILINYSSVITHRLNHCGFVQDDQRWKRRP